MNQQATLKGSDLAKVLENLYKEGKFADASQVQVLRLEQVQRQVQIELYFQGEVCIHAHSSIYPYRLEELLYRRRLLDNTQLGELKQLALASPEHSIAELLLAQQWISESELAQVANTLTEIISYQSLLWKNITYRLIAAERPPQQYFGTGLNPAQLTSVVPFIKAANKYTPVLTLMRERLGNANTVVQRLKQAGRSQISAEQYHVYRFVNNRNRIRDLVQLSELSYFDTLAVIYQLLSWGYISLGQIDMQTVRKTDRLKSESPTPPTVHSQTQARLEKRVPHDGQAELLRDGCGYELLQVMVSFLESGYDDGCLIVKDLDHGQEAEFSLFQGNLVHAATSAFETRLGDMLIRRGLLEPKQLKAAVKLQKSTPDSRLGEILIENQMIAENAVPDLIKQQMEAILYEVLAWPNVSFYIAASTYIPQYKIKHQIPLHASFEINDGRVSRKEPSDQPNLLEAADQNLPILLMMRTKFPNLKALPQASAKLDGILLTPEQEALMQLADGQSSLQEILLSSREAYFPAYMNLFHLLSMGALRLPEDKPEQLTRPTARPATRVQKPAVAKPAGSQPPVAARPPTQAEMEAETLALLRRLPSSHYPEVRRILLGLLETVPSL
ncbi:MAG: DUF4388 domain-containing protein [Candidatus Sericytochromatia bacterium]